MKTILANSFRILAVLLLLVMVANRALAQPFIEEINSFKKTDSLQFPAAGSNLFVGSSSLRMWKNIQSDLAGYPILNRGFGGSSFPDLIRYANDIIIPYKPGRIFIYCGDNDLAASDTVTPQAVAARFQELFGIIRSQLKNVPVYFISIKPSPSRAHLLGKMVESNRLIREFLASQTNTGYIDVYTKMLNEEGQPRKELFLDDMLHMNVLGYAIWIREIEPYLKK